MLGGDANIWPKEALLLPLINEERYLEEIHSGKLKFNNKGSDQSKL